MNLHENWLRTHTRRHRWCDWGHRRHRTQNKKPITIITLDDLSVCVVLCILFVCAVRAYICQSSFSLRVRLARVCLFIKYSCRQRLSCTWTFSCIFVACETLLSVSLFVLCSIHLFIFSYAVPQRRRARNWTLSLSLTPFRLFGAGLLVWVWKPHTIKSDELRMQYYCRYHRTGDIIIVAEIIY